jgi:hypothetical protein
MALMNFGVVFHFLVFAEAVAGGGDPGYALRKCFRDY